jgi:hypothetical protein
MFSFASHAALLRAPDGLRVDLFQSLLPFPDDPNTASRTDHGQVRSSSSGSKAQKFWRWNDSRNFSIAAMVSLVGTSAGTVAYCAPAEPSIIAQDKSEANAIVDALAPIAEQLTLGSVMVCLLDFLQRTFLVFPKAKNATQTPCRRPCRLEKSECQQI